jgi:LysR family glycine cleavage system transcriptional activator/LysR family transcriptional regulator of beta-lactamase
MIDRMGEPGTTRRARTSLTALRAFEAVGRTGSLTTAAQELSVTRPAVSKQIRLLEGDLGCALVHRRPRGIELTEAGRDLFQVLQQSFDLIGETFARLKARNAAPGSLRVRVEQDFAASWLAGNIGRFLVAHPGIAFEMVAVPQGTRQGQDGFDFDIFYTDIRKGVMQADGHPSRELCRWFDLPLCAPNYAEKLGPQAAEGLGNAHLLHDRDHNFWIDWLHATGMEDQVDPMRGTVFNGTSLCLSAAKAGAGIAIGDTLIAAADIRDGTLVMPYPHALRSAKAYVLYRRSCQRQSPQQRAFEDWIAGELDEHARHTEGWLRDIGATIEDRRVR